MPWLLGTLLRNGPSPLQPRPRTTDHLTVTLVLGPTHTTPRDAGLPPELLTALESEGIHLHILTSEEAETTRPPTPHAEQTEAGALRISRRDRPADAPTPTGAPPSGDAPSPAATPSAAAPSPVAAPSGPLADADVVLAAGWTAAPAVLTARGVRARAVLATAEPAPLADLGWTRDIPVLGPA
ncbi:MAG TPA: hypothetical protein VNT55_22040 [Baekduia sp.]|nr:hypothetical protein [Baekduia sp.]